MRRVLLLASAMVFLDLTFFTAIAPLLPIYKHDLGLSTAQAGILSAAYAAGTLTFSLPGGYIASNFGPRRTVISGLFVFAVATLLFGFLKSAWPLDGARFIQGIASALIWSGALTWLINSYPEEKRGQVIGTALGTAVAGSLLGPVLGALAASIGTEIIFGGVFVVALGLAFLAWREPDTVVTENQPLREVLRCMVDRELIEAAIFVSSPSLMFGAIDVLLPLRIGNLGGGHALIAGAFVGGAAIESTLSPIAGRLSDKVGRRTPYLLGMAICALAMLIFAVADSLPIVVLALLTTSLGSGLCFAPAMTLISDAAEASGLHQGHAVGVTNMAWAAAPGDGPPSTGVPVLRTATTLYGSRAFTPWAEGDDREPLPAEA